MITRARLSPAVHELRLLFDATHYLELYPDVGESGIDPVEHYLLYGADDNREPCPLFDGGWYRAQNADVASSGLNPLLHYIRHGGVELRDPHPRFNAAYYAQLHPEAADNPLLYHLVVGLEKGWSTEPALPISELLPSTLTPPAIPDIDIDVIIPVYRGYRQTIRCITSVLDDPRRLARRVIVIDDASPEPRLSAWLTAAARKGRITLLRNRRNVGFVRSVNRGMAEAAGHDVVLLNSDTEVPAGWLQRLARAAYSATDVATVSPLSNNATICSYPSPNGGKLPEGIDLATLDAACGTANAGRYTDVPTSVGFCMYIRRAALDLIGEFDAATFGLGYGEEVDFCRRAIALGWRHLLACDVFVFHEGAVSFGAASAGLKRSHEIIRARYPDYEDAVKRFVSVNPALASRFALTASVLRNNGKPGILLISHAKGGGVARHVDDLLAQLQGQANFFQIAPDPYGVALSVPTLPGHPVLQFNADRHDDLAGYLRFAGVVRVHIHHTMDIAMDLPSLIQALGVSFDLTIHDYFGLCPQVNLLPTVDSHYCGEPDARQCNACIAANPGNGATDIDSWRLGHAWMFRDATRVICPSRDARARLTRYGLGEHTIVVPHQDVIDDTSAPPPPRRPERSRDRQVMKVALLGVLADRKGLGTVASVVDAAGDDLSFHLVGYPEHDLEPPLAARLSISGRYAEPDFPALIGKLRPDIFWFPAQWPETYSYTLSAAIAAGGAIVATDIGAFTERLKGRPLTWLLPPSAPPKAWLDAFAAVRAAYRSGTSHHPPRMRLAQQDFYTRAYLRPLTQAVRDGGRPAPVAAKAVTRTALVIPDRLDNGLPSPCAYIRLIQPLCDTDVSSGWDVRVADEASALDGRADTIITQRHAITSLTDADALIAHCRTRKIRLIYDLDDDLLHVPDDHPDAARLRPQIPVVQRMLANADAIWTSTPELAARIGPCRRKPMVVANGLDARLWWPPPSLDRPPAGPLRLLYMGTATHVADLELILPALQRLVATFGPRIAIDIIGITPLGLPDGLNRINPPAAALRSYPAFVNWLSLENRWHLGLAPLADTAFNRGKSAIKALDYAALGLPTVASGFGVYEAAVSDGVSGLLVENTQAAWFGALAGLIRDPIRRRRLAQNARETLAARFTITAQARWRRKLLLGR